MISLIKSLSCHLIIDAVMYVSNNYFVSKYMSV